MALSVEDFEIDTNFPTYAPSSEDSDKMWFVLNRLASMQSARTFVDKNWDDYQTMVDAIRVPYRDGRSSSEVPLASALIELYVAEALKLATEFNFRGETSNYYANAKALEHVWKYDRRKKNRKKAFTRNEYITAAFGTSIIYTGYEAYTKVQYDPTVNDDMSLWWDKKEIEKRDIIVEDIDIRNFRIDNQAIDGIEDASDCVLRERVSFEKFKCYENNPLYKNTKYVQPTQYSSDWRTFTTQEDRSRQWDYVELIHYWNVERDMYVVIANWVLVREQHMMSTIDWEKALPFVIRVLWYKNYSIYGRWLCEALLTFNSDVNNLRELLMDAIKRSNTQVLAIGKWLSFDGRWFSYDNEILTFDWDLAGNFEQLSGNPPNKAIFSYLDRLYKDIAIYVGIDVQNILWEPQQTAFQTEVQREASQKRVNVWLTNRDLAFERFANLHKDNLCKFFPLKDAEWIYPQIEIDWEELIGEWEKKRFRKKKGKSMFEVTPELLRWDMYVDVYTNATAPTINAVDRQQKLDLLQSVPIIAQWYALAKQSWFDLDSILPMKQTLKDLASDYNISPQDSDDQEDVTALKQELVQQLQWMLQSTQWWWQPPVDVLTPWWEAPTLSPNPPQWVPAMANT